MHDVHHSPDRSRSGGPAHRPPAASFLGLWRVFTALVATLALAAAGLLTHAPDARADINPGINVEITKLIVVTPEGVEQPGAGAGVNSYVDMHFTWDARTANPQPGDSFQVILSEYFQMKEPQIKELLFNGQVVGHCDIQTDRITCTFNDGIKGKVDVHGTGKVTMRAIKGTTSTTTTFTVNGTATEVTNPNGSGITSGAGNYVTWGFKKDAESLKKTDTRIRWRIYFNGDDLARLYGGIDNVPETIEWTDTLGDGMKWDAAQLAPAFALGGYEDNAGYWKEIRTFPYSGPVGNPDPAGNTPVGNIDLSYNITNDKTVTVSVKNDKWRLKQNYVLYLYAVPTSTDGNIQQGVTYTNSASIKGETLTGKVKYIESAIVTITMKDGYGSFNLTKALQGSALGQVPGDTKYTVKANWTLPDNKVPSDYPDWTDVPANPLVLEVESGPTTQPPYQFPVGTTITFEEVLPTVAGVQWETPVFDPASITITNQVSAAVKLTNTAVPGSGKFKVVKAVNAGGADLTGKTFTFEYTCSDGQGGTLTLQGAGEVESDKSFPLGTTCAITELTASAQVEGYTLTYTDPVDVTINSATTPVAANFTNTYTQDVGKFSIAKTVVANGANAPANYTFRYTCGSAPEATATVPGDGTAVEFGPFPVGTVCTISEDLAAAAVNGYTLDAVLSASSVTIAKDQTIALTATNTYTQDVGKFSIAKTVVANGANAPANYTFRYTCGSAPEATATVPGDGTAVEFGPFPVGTVCTISEDLAAAAVNGYTLDAVLSASSVTIAKDQTIALTATNTYTRETGGFSITKTVDGDGAALAPTQFIFTYTCTDAVTGNVSAPVDVVVAAGQSVSVTDIPTGTCTVVEKDASAVNTELETVFTVDGAPANGSEVTINVTAGSAINVSATNTYTLDRGTFTIAKSVTGDRTGSADEEFKVTYTCSHDNNPVEVTLKGDGTVFNGPSLPVGTTCTVVEDATSAQRDGFALATTYQNASVTIAKNETTPVVVTNNYTRLVGDFMISKTVEGDGSTLAPVEFTFTYTCTDAVTGNVSAPVDVVVAAGQSVSVTNVPTGTCTVVEKDATVANTALETTWTVDGQAVDGPEISINVEDRSAINVSANNTYTLDRGTFDLTKKVKGLASETAAGKEFSFTYTCTSDVEGTVSGVIKVKGDGKAVDSNLSLPIGTTCTITEDATSAKVAGYNLKTVEPQKVTIEEKDQTVSVTFTNEYTEVPPGKVAKTGTEAGALLLLTSVIGGAGLLLFALRRRKA